MKTDTAAALKGCSLFGSLPEEYLETLAADGGIELRRCENGCALSLDHELCAVLSGSLVVEKAAADDHRIIMNVIPRGGVAGISSLYGEQPLSVLRAKGDTVVAALSREVFEALCEKYPAFAVDCIKYLSGRIVFLNRKIEGFAGYSVLSRLAFFLARNAQPAEEGFSVELPVCVRDLADVLSVSRASLYRAFEELAGAGVIRREGKKITIPDIRALNNFKGEER